jgi:iron complex outermembrane recepter protein
MGLKLNFLFIKTAKQWCGSVLVFFSIVLCQAQTSGYVMDAIYNKPLIGAHVQWGQNQVVTTDSLGFFSLHKQGGNTLVISHVGYHEKKVRADDGVAEIIFMEPLHYQIGDVNVTTWNRFERIGDIAGSVALLPVESVSTGKDGSLVSKLAGVPGVMAHEGTFNTNRIVVRGIGTRTPYATNGIKAYLNEIPLTSGDGVTPLGRYPPCFDCKGRVGQRS